MEKSLIVLMLPGSGIYPDSGSYENLSPIYEMQRELREYGIDAHCVAKDRYSRPHSPYGPLFDEYVEPAIMLCDILERHSGLRPKIILGHSFGAHVSPYVASALKGTVGFILLNGHVSSLVEIFNWQCHRLCATELVDDPVIACALTIEQKLIPNDLMRTRSYDFENALKLQNAKTLCVRTAEDDTLPPFEEEAWERLMANSWFQMRRYPDLDHDLQPTSSHGGAILPGMITDIQRWITEMTGELP